MLPSGKIRVHAIANVAFLALDKLAPDKSAQDMQFASLSHLQALIWIAAAVFLQSAVIAILVYARNK